MKILFINNFFCLPGGVETIMYNEAKLLREKEHEVYFFATDKQPYLEENYEYAEYFTKYTDFKSFKGLESVQYFKIFYNFEAAKKLNKLIKEIKPDIVHIHNYDYYLTSSVVDVCHKNKVPMVKTFHDFRFICPGGTFMKDFQYCQEESCIRGNTLHCLLNRCKNEKFIDSLFVSAENLLVRLSKVHNKIRYFIFPSKAMQDIALKAGIDQRESIVINNFVRDEFLREEPCFDNKGYFLYAGRLSPEKGLNFLLQAMSDLPEEIQLHIAGSGSEENNLKKLADELKLNNVSFIGTLEGKDLIEEYRHCISTILPCNWFEIFGVSIIESFAMGKPVIASKVGAIPEIIDDSNNGFLCQPGNVEELKLKINQLYNDNELVKEMGKKAREKVEKLYNSEKHIFKLIETYNRLS